MIQMGQGAESGNRELDPLPFQGALRLPGYSHPPPGIQPPGAMLPLGTRPTVGGFHCLHLASWGAAWNPASEAKPQRLPGPLSCHAQHCAWHRPGLRKYLPPLIQLLEPQPPSSPIEGALPTFCNPLPQHQLFPLRDGGGIAGTRCGAQKREVTHPRSLGEGARERKRVFAD